MNGKLPRRALGATGLNVSIIGFGASPLGNVFGNVDHSVAVDAVKTAFELGINLFDTSPFYGSTRSETVLGNALAESGVPRQEIVLATKVGRYGEAAFDFSAQRVKDGVRESLARLQTSYIDLIQVHDMEFGDLDLIIAETLPALQELRDQGLVRHIGITSLPLLCFTYILDRVPSGIVEVVLSYCHYTLCDTSLDSLLPYFESKGVGIINASVLSMGLLTPQGPPAWHPAPQELQDACRAAAAAAAKHGVSLPKMGIMHAMQNPGIAAHLVGFASPEQVEDAVSATLQGLGLEPNPDAGREAQARVEIALILEPCRGTTWPSGIPENQARREH